MVAAVVDDGHDRRQRIPDPENDDVRLAQDGTEENLPNLVS